MNDILSGLNEEQQEAVTTTEGFVRIIAGAGSGKTKALTHRYAYLVKKLGISTPNILCATFTNKAANEMKNRIRNMIGDNDTGFVCTFHGFCVQLLKEDIHTLNYPPNFKVMDIQDREDILKLVYEASHIRSKDYTLANAISDITLEKDKDDMSYITYLADLNNTELKHKYENATDNKSKVFFGYLLEQKKIFGLDFEDLINVSIYILEKNQEKREKWQKRMMYVMVDEFQDVSNNQYKLADILSGYHQNLFVVGDPDQTIYSWRGADVDYILEFDQLHKDTKTIFMNKNYRSTPNILNASNSLIKKNKKRIEKELFTDKEQKDPVVYNHLKTTALEAEWIATQIKKLINNNNTYNDIAILYRSHHVSKAIEEELIKEKIPYTLYSGQEFYKRKEIKDTISYLRMLAFQDDLSFLRVVNEPKRGIGKKRITVLKEYAELHNCSLYNALLQKQNEKLFRSTQAEEFIAVIEKYKNIYEEMKLSEIVSGILDESGYEAILRQEPNQERLDNLAELKQALTEYEQTAGEDISLEEYLQSIALYTDSEKEAGESSVKMMTVHTAKGLEFPYVFLCELNEGIFPSKRVDTEEKMEEERRLAYVAFTRAEKALFLSDAEGNNLEQSFRYPSRFIFDVEKKYLSYVVELEPKFIDKALEMIKRNEESLSMIVFEEGDHVRHEAFGIGEIIEVRRDISSYVIKFDNVLTERSLDFKAPLEKVSTTNLENIE